MKLNEIVSDKEHKIRELLIKFGIVLASWDHETGEIFSPAGRKSSKASHIKDIEILPDGTVNIDGYVDLSEFKFASIPFKFGKISGGLTLSENPKLKTLIGCPTECKAFDITLCTGLTSLAHSPKILRGSFSAFGCSNLVSITECPEQIDGTVILNSCHKLKSLKGLPRTIGGSLVVSKIAGSNFSLEGMPEELGTHAEDGDLHLNDLSINKFTHLPKRIKGFIDISNSNSNNATNLLALFKVRGVTEIKIDHNKKLESILNKYIADRDAMSCQEELMDSGFGEFAKS
jgi:hypothetical protein